jgi:serine phosphatase RsbU (regulator of sigma subunit)
LLDLQVKETATVLQAVLPATETPLASAVEIAATNHGSAAAFRSYISAYVGQSPKPFAAASLWQVQANRVREIAATGRALALPGSAIGTKQTLLAGAKQSSVTLVGPLALRATRPRVGYTFASKGYLIYAEALLPAHRRAVIQRGSPFSNLRFALYLGPSTSAAALLETNVDHLPVSGDTATATAPFGSSALTLVATSSARLGGGLSAAVWWIVIVIGLLLAGLVTVAAEWLVRRRRQAEGATAEAELQLAEQRSLARMLQQALLPEVLVSPPGLQATARYVTGVVGVDIGGDWYDLIALDDQRAFFVIGDVSGRGVPAGTTMAALRFAIHAFVHEGHEPATVLDRLVGLIDVGRDGQFATVLCGTLDIERHELTVASAGHLPPLIIADGATAYVDLPIGPPVGVSRTYSYSAVTVPVPPRAIVMAFTDGLIERPGDSLDSSLEQLKSLAGSATSLDEIFDRIVPDLSAGSTDDIAILGVQWLT